MSESGLSTSQINAAGAYAQADRLVAAVPVRPIDPTRQRFQVAERDAAEQAAAQKSQANDADTDASQPGRGQGQAAGGWARGGFALVGAFTAFLTRLFAQDDVEPAAAVPSAQAAGAQAYARAASAALTADGITGDILPPSFPRLSSGRAVDLSV